MTEKFFFLRIFVNKFVRKISFNMKIDVLWILNIFVRIEPLKRFNFFHLKVSIMFILKNFQ